MEPFLVLPFAGGIGAASRAIADNQRVNNASPLSYRYSFASRSHFVLPDWTVTATPGPKPAARLIGPGDQAENQEEEDQDDLELESDEDPTKLRSARTLVAPEDGSTAARGGDGTINPPFP